MAAMELDYSDHSQFTNAFLKASGVLPGDLRDK
jgi:AraC-like DNA-binding protein